MYNSLTFLKTNEIEKSDESPSLEPISHLYFPASFHLSTNFETRSNTHPQSADGTDSEATTAEAAGGEGLNDGVVLVAHREARLGRPLCHPLPVGNHL